MLPGYGRITQALLGTLLTWGLTAAGACCVLFLRGNHRKSLDAALGFAAGVMVAASFWSLLNPAIEMAENSMLYGSFAFVPVTIGFLVGALFVFGCDLIITKFSLNTFNIILQISKNEEKANSTNDNCASHTLSNHEVNRLSISDNDSNKIHITDDQHIRLEMLPETNSINDDNHCDVIPNDMSDSHLQTSSMPRISSFSDCLTAQHQHTPNKQKLITSDEYYRQRAKNSLNRKSQSQELQNSTKSVNSINSEPRRRKNSTFDLHNLSTSNRKSNLRTADEVNDVAESLLRETPPTAAAVAAAIAEQWKRIILLVIAITVHNIPEGLAVGVSFGAIGSTNSSTFESARNLAIGIGIQNFPEGLAVSLPLRAAGFSMWRALWYGQLSGMVEPIFGVLGAVAVTMVSLVLPYALAFAAGAMIYIVIDDILPEAHASGHGFIATWSAMTGFIVMMILDVALS